MYLQFKKAFHNFFFFLIGTFSSVLKNFAIHPLLLCLSKNKKYIYIVALSKGIAIGKSMCNSCSGWKSAKKNGEKHFA